ncbi:MAG: hypothetical protein OEZ36_06895 [Spirochaetota bacterium]|nr:hypothetical protein [Spirochaetota bacterium]
MDETQIKTEKSEDEDVKGWGTLYFLSGLLAVISIISAVFINIWVGGIIFHVALFAMLFWGMTRD